MIRKTLNLFLAIGAAATVGIGAAAASGGGTAPLKHEHWSFAGPFGTYDKEAMQRGYQVYETICSNCHGVSLLAFRNLGEKGGPFHLDQTIRLSLQILGIGAIATVD